MIKFDLIIGTVVFILVIQVAVRILKLSKCTEWPMLEPDTFTVTKANATPKL